MWTLILLIATLILVLISIFSSYVCHLYPLQLLFGDMYEQPEPKKPKFSPYFVTELTHILAACEDRIPFVTLGDEVIK